MHVANQTSFSGMRAVECGRSTKGIVREGSGRRHTWFLEACRKIFDKHKLLEFLAEVASGKNVPQPFTDGEVFEAPAAIKERLRAIEMLKEWGYGKTVSEAELNAVGITINFDPGSIEQAKLRQESIQTQIASRYQENGNET